MKSKAILLFFLTICLTTKAQNFEWVQSFGGTSNDLGNSIAVDASGNVYTTGYFSGTVDFDPGAGTANLSSVGQFDVFVQKLDASGNYQWARSFGSSLNDVGQSVAVDASGNVYTTGRFRGTVDFDPGAGTANFTSAGQDDIFVQKLDASGNYLWAKRFGGSSGENGNFITLDALGHVYTTGAFQGTVDFDPGVATFTLTSIAGSFDGFVQKLDASGNFVWARSLGGNSDDDGRSIRVNASGDIYTTGIFRETVDFDPGAGTANLTSSGQEDIYVQKLDASGNFLWARSFGNASMDISSSIEVDALGNVFITGFFRGTVDFDPNAGIANLTSAGLDDAFIQKLDATGNFIWARSFGGSGADQGLSVASDASGNVYTMGVFEGTVDFDPGAGIANLLSGGFDIFVQKLDAAGNFQWANSFGAVGASIAVDDIDNVFTTGYFIGTVDFDSEAGVANLSSAGSTDVFVKKMSQCVSPPAPTTSTQSAICAGNTATITPSAGGTNYRFYSEATGGNPLAGGNGVASFTTPALSATTTFYVASVSAAGCESDTRTAVTVVVNSGSVGLQTETACGSYTWPANASTYNTSGFYTTTLTNAAGCDSVITLNLTINSVSNIETTTTDLTITANNAGATYQWLDCNNGIVPIAGETNQSFTATVSGSYAVELIEDGCVDTSACVTVLVTGITEKPFSESIRVYPNPAVQEFTIDLGTIHETARVSIKDVMGRIVHTSNYAFTSTIQVSLNESAGLYFIEIASGEKRAMLKVINQ